jgi:hypothetical protein
MFFGNTGLKDMQAKLENRAVVFGGLNCSAHQDVSSILLSYRRRLARGIRNNAISTKNKIPPK